MNDETFELEDEAHVHEKLLDDLEHKQERARELTSLLRRTLILRRWLKGLDEVAIEATIGDPMKGPLTTSWTGGVNQGWTFSVSRPGFPDTVRFDGRTLPAQMRSEHAQRVVNDANMGYGDAREKLIADVARSLKLDTKILRTALYQNRKEIG